MRKHREKFIQQTGQDKYDRVEKQVKIISAIENSLSQQVIQRLNPAQQKLISIFLEYPNVYKSKPTFDHKGKVLPWQDAY